MGNGSMGIIMGPRPSKRPGDVPNGGIPPGGVPNMVGMLSPSIPGSLVVAMLARPWIPRGSCAGGVLENPGGGRAEGPFTRLNPESVLDLGNWGSGEGGRFSSALLSSDWKLFSRSSSVMALGGGAT